MKLLLHTCCGPCFLGVWEDLRNKDLEITNYHFNPNIYPKEEYQRRLDNFRAATLGKSKAVVVPEYEPAQYRQAVRGQGDNFPERCKYCYRLRLFEAAKFAKENNYDAFSTTLLVSPYQDHGAIKKIGEDAAKEFGIKFYYEDWRPFFRAGQKAALEMEIYRQKYCGCEYSRDFR